MALTPDFYRNINGLKVNTKIIPWGAAWIKDWGNYSVGDNYKADRLLSGGTGKPKGITIHNTDGSANAETYTRATYPNQNMGTARVHFYVDDVEAWQNLQENEVGWHAGDGLGDGNETTIAIEIIMRGDAIKDDDQSKENGAILTAYLLHKHGLTIDDVYKHQHWSGKYCPAYLIPEWDSFIARVEHHFYGLHTQGQKMYRVQVGAFTNKEYAEAYLQTVKESGFDGAFIVEADIPPTNPQTGAKA